MKSPAALHARGLARGAVLHRGGTFLIAGTGQPPVPNDAALAAIVDIDEARRGATYIVEERADGSFTTRVLSEWIT